MYTPTPSFAGGRARTIAALKDLGIRVGYSHVVGEPFWMTLEIAENRAMGERSVEVLEAEVAV